MSESKEVKTIDANVLLDYILQGSSKDSDKKKKINKFFNPTNNSNVEVRIFVYALGEVFKKLLEPRNGNVMKLDDAVIQTKLCELQRWIKDKSLTIVKMDSNLIDFQKHYNYINTNDSLIQQGDKVILAAFCSDQGSKSFYTSDRYILESVKLSEYVRGMRKEIQEP
jgi:hypothetical protein